MPFFDVENGVTTGDQSLWNQYADALTGQQDADITLYQQISAPGAPAVTVNTAAGNLTGNYQYALAYQTGYWQGAVGSGTLHTKGNTGGGAASAVISPNGQQANVPIPSAPTGVVNVLIYRTKAGGSSFFYLDKAQANTATNYVDNIADANLGAAMPTTNTTGGKFKGDGSELTNLPIPSVPNASPTTAGVVKSTGTSDVALTTDGGTMTGPLVLNADPTQALGAATKEYVDAMVQGIPAHAEVRVATTGANITLSGLQTIDGVSVAANDRVLVKDQTTQTDNGIYVAASGAWTRSTDTMVAGIYVFVAEGTSNANSGWRLNLDPDTTITIGTTALTWSQFNGVGDITAGTGLAKSGNTLSVVNAGTGAVGGVEVADAPSSGPPVAITKDNAAYKAVNGGTYVAAGDGIKTTPGVNSETVAVDSTVARNNADSAFSAQQTFSGGIKVTGDSNLRRYNMSATGADSNDIYATVTYTRADGTKYLVSVLSGTVDSNGNYPTMTNTFYKTDGTTVDHTDTWSLTYDASGKLTGRTVSTA